MSECSWPISKLWFFCLFLNCCFFLLVSAGGGLADVVVFWNGTYQWNYVSSFQTSRTNFMRNFPFDVQVSLFFPCPTISVVKQEMTSCMQSRAPRHNKCAFFLVSGKKLDLTTEGFWCVLLTCFCHTATHSMINHEKCLLCRNAQCNFYSGQTTTQKSTWPTNREKLAWQTRSSKLD